MNIFFSLLVCIIWVTLSWVVQLAEFVHYYVIPIETPPNLVQILIKYEYTGTRTHTPTHTHTDQIGSAIPKLCWDASHAHTLGGGDFWTEGYRAMMQAIDDRLYSDDKSTVTKTAAKSASTRSPSACTAYPMVTEDNAEPYMSMVQGFLTLDAFKTSLAQSPVNTLQGPRMSPAYPMVS